MERSIRYNFSIDLESIQHELSSDYSLKKYISRAVFAILTVHHFLRKQNKPLQNVDFSKVGNMQFFFPRNCTYILTRTQGKKFEDMFLVKIASKGTSLRWSETKNLKISIPDTIFLFSLIIIKLCTLKQLENVHQKLELKFL